MGFIVGLIVGVILGAGGALFALALCSVAEDVKEDN